MLNSEWKFSIPMPILLVIDDVGWWSGEDASERQGPYRTGIDRRHVPADYEALAALGRKLGVRPQAAFVICEWDRENILRDLPTSTWMGEAWDNARWVGPWLDEAADILRRNRDHLELVVHGIGHEYWEGGQFTRSEFHLSGGTMRPRREVVRHLEYFARIMDQNGLGPFPESLVPPAFIHSFGNGEAGIQAILRDFGVKYVSTLFRGAKQFAPPQHERIMVECGVMIVERGNVGIPWYEFASEPRLVSGQPIYGLHWPNLLHPDPARNLEIVDRWADFLRGYNHRLDSMLAPDTPACWTQFAYNALSEIAAVQDGLEIDITRVQALPSAPLLDWFTVKVNAPETVRWKVDGGVLLSAEFDTQAGHHILRLKPEDGRTRLRLRGERCG